MVLSSLPTLQDPVEAIRAQLGLQDLAPLVQQAQAQGFAASQAAPTTFNVGTPQSPKGLMDLAQPTSGPTHGTQAPGDLVTRHGVTLDPNALTSLVQAQHALGDPILAQVISSYRSVAEQRRLYQAHLNGTHPGPVARPGQSMHNLGLAVDINSGYLSQHPEVRRYLLNNGWFQFDPASDPGHFSFGREG